MNTDYKCLKIVHLFVMAALCNRAGHIYFHPVICSFFFFFLSSPNLSRRRLDVYHTCTCGVALVRISANHVGHWPTHSSYIFFATDDVIVTLVNTYTSMMGISTEDKYLIKSLPEK